jgi:predicted RNA-binding Zn-ribbon protein involved in translation (DUF1610 family)
MEKLEKKNNNPLCPECKQELKRDFRYYYCPKCGYVKVI